MRSNHFLASCLSFPSLLLLQKKTLLRFFHKFYYTLCQNFIFYNCFHLKEPWCFSEPLFLIFLFFLLKKKKKKVLPFLCYLRVGFTLYFNLHYRSDSITLLWVWLVCVLKFHRNAWKEVISPWMGKFLL